MKSLLVADDDKDVRTTLARWLALEGFDVHAVDSGQAAIAALEQRHFDAVITDMRMPNGDGLFLLDGVRARFATLPVIMITGFCDQDAAELQGRGVTLVHTKPFKLDELLADLEKLIGRK
jgi:DNA-binding NtrC family response regulator